MSFPTFQEIVDALQARPLDVAQRYAPGGHVDTGKYWALCPWRQDKRIGSFYVNLSGSHAGRFMDHSSGEHGDMLDLIQKVLNLDRRDALTEARAFLGMDEETPTQAALRARQAKRAKDQQEIDAKAAIANKTKKSRNAQGMYLRSDERIIDTPVAKYLSGRAIGIERLGRTPHSIRFHDALPYSHTDKETGEIVEGNWPAMVTAIYGPAIEGGGKPAFWGVHRTWLSRREDGSWGKADVPNPKKSYGQLKGGYIRLWAGIGPRGGKGAPLSKATAGSRVYITEGIEDGLSVAVLKPEARVLVATTLGNIREMLLPASISHVTIVADNDPHPEQSRQIDMACSRFAREGRKVDVWRNEYGGKDLNEALVAAMKEDGAA